MKIAITTAVLLGAAGLVAAGVTAGVPASRADLLAGDAADSNGTVSLTPRKAQYGHARGRVICGKYANANYDMFGDLVYKLDNGNRNKEFTIAGGQCDRVSCYDTTALYVCNDNKDPITVTGKEIAIAFVYIRNHCCHRTRNGNADNNVSGQQFTPWGWNVNAGYGNCNDPVNIRPHMAGGEGVNPGSCLAADLPNVSF